MGENQLGENQLRENQLRENQLRENQLGEKQLGENQLRENQHDKNQFTEDLKIHKHTYIRSETPILSAKKHFVFDVDETIGSFSDFYLLWRGLIHLQNQLAKHTDLTKTHFQENIENFTKILDLYPEFLRPGILSIFKYLHHKKKQGFCHGIHIYTNNNCKPPWVELLETYLERLGQTSKLFDEIITSFKLGSKRTTYAKTLSDFFRCSLLPKDIEICFIDNSYFPKMKNSRVFYIQPKAYFHGLSINEILTRFQKSTLGQTLKVSDTWKTSMVEWFFQHGYQPTLKTYQEKNGDILVSKRLMYHIKDFFYLTLRKPKTRKVRGRFWFNITKRKR